MARKKKAAEPSAGGSAPVELVEQPSPRGSALSGPGTPSVDGLGTLTPPVHSESGMSLSSVKNQPQSLGEDSAGLQDTSPRPGTSSSRRRIGYERSDTEREEEEEAGGIEVAGGTASGGYSRLDGEGDAEPETLPEDPPRRFPLEYEPRRSAEETELVVDEDEVERTAHRKTICALIHHACCLCSGGFFAVLIVSFCVYDVTKPLGLRVAMVVLMWGVIVHGLVAFLYFFLFAIGDSERAEVDFTVGFDGFGRVGYGFPPALSCLDDRMFATSKRFPLFILVSMCVVCEGVVISLMVLGNDMPLILLFIPWYLIMLLATVAPWVALLQFDRDTVWNRVQKFSHLCYFPLLFGFFAVFSILFVQKMDYGYDDYTWDYVFFPLWCALGLTTNIGCFCPSFGSFSAFDYRLDDRAARRAARHDEEHLGARCQHRVVNVWLRIMWAVFNFCFGLTAYMACQYSSQKSSPDKHLPLFAVLAPVLTGSCFFVVFDAIVLFVQCLVATGELDMADELLEP